MLSKSKHLIICILFAILPTPVKSQNIQLYISYIDINEEFIDISIDSDTPIYGYQFQISNVAIEYGEALIGAESGFFVSINSNGYVLGYGFPGMPIDSTHSPLCRLYYIPTQDVITCIQDPTIALQSGPFSPAIGECEFIDTSPFAIPGDLNQDSILDILDIVIYVETILTIDEVPIDLLYIGDINQDSLLNILDIMLIINQIL
ncbi:MAG: hypothetical protein ISR95_07890 [Candidatus Marinimicrobia bacterium]|nr:hypothetical protein [Candidatus Neomarinimicrobiota bacterium]